MLCSVLIPSRKRFDKLLRCIESVYDHADSYVPFEIIVRFHKSDEEARDRCVELDDFRFHPISAIWGEDLAGYDSLGPFCHELIQQATGIWVWHLNDDMVVLSPSGRKWNTELNAVIGKNILVQPELHQLNNSVYVFDKSGPAPFHRREALGDALLQPACGSACDMTIYTELVVRRHWQVRFLEGIGIHHQWGGTDSHVT